MFLGGRNLTYIMIVSDFCINLESIHDVKILNLNNYITLKTYIYVKYLNNQFSWLLYLSWVSTCKPVFLWIKITCCKALVVSVWTKKGKGDNKKAPKPMWHYVKPHHSLNPWSRRPNGPGHRHHQTCRHCPRCCFYVVFWEAVWPRDACCCWLLQAFCRSSRCENCSWPGCCSRLAVGRRPRTAG